MRKVKYGLLAGMVAAAMLAMTACGNNAENNGTTGQISSTTAATTESGINSTTVNDRNNNNNTNGTDNGGVLENMGEDIKNGAEEIATDMGIDGNKRETTTGAGEAAAPMP